ncbi:MAG TPA: hypothetical protein PLE60_12520 [Candidatus Latescibacteria bacterium]|nr:hypothetical protein [Candidatus Latescibacterota bacterium]
MRRWSRILCGILLAAPLLWPGCCGDCIVGFNRRCPEVIADVPRHTPNAFFAWAYGGHAGFERAPAQPVTILFQKKAGADSGYFQLSCSPGGDANYCGVVNRFCVDAVAFDTAYGLARYRTPDSRGSPANDPAYYIALPTDSVTITSNRIQSAISSSPTVYDTTLVTLYANTTADPPTLTPDRTPLVTLAWSRYPLATQAVLLTNDAQGNLLSGVVILAGTTASPTTWTYGTPGARTLRSSQPVQSGTPCTLTVWLLNDAHWSLAVDQVTFTPQ